MNSVLCYLSQVELDSLLQAICEYFDRDRPPSDPMRLVNLKMIETARDLLILRQKADELSIVSSGQVPPDLYYTEDA